MSDLLHQPIRIAGATVRNRLYRAPVLEGTGDGPQVVEVYARHLVENARNGVGLVIQGPSCTLPEGRTSSGMTCLDTGEKVLRLAPMVEAVHDAGASIFLQLGHGGIYAMEAWHELFASRRQGPILAASPLPWFLRPLFGGVPVHVLTTDEVRARCHRYGTSPVGLGRRGMAGCSWVRRTPSSSISSSHASRDRVVPAKSLPACPPVRPVEAGLAACSAARRRGAAYY